METNKIIQGDCLEVLKTLPNDSVDCVITSPPYWALRDYGVAGQLGLESSFQEYITKLCNIFDEIKRVLKPTGTCWVNIGDTYGGTGKKSDTNDKYKKGLVRDFDRPNGKEKQKCLLQIPARFSIEMINRGWILRNEIIWHKPNAMPSSALDRFTVDFEKVFFFTKNKKYYFEQQLEKSIWAEKDKRFITGKITKSGKSTSDNGKQYQISTSGAFRKDGKRNVRAVWKIPTKGYKESHFATYPEALIEPMVKAGCPVHGTILDPFFGAGTTGVVSKKNNRNYIGIELNVSYIDIAQKRIDSTTKSLF